MLVTTVQLTGAAYHYSHMEIHTSTVNTEISLAREFQKYISEKHEHIACWIIVRT